MADEAAPILLIEDESFLRNLLTMRLQREGFTVEIAEDGVEGVEKIKSLRPRLVLLDLILPKMNGFELLQQVAEDPQLAKIPVIIISNLGQESDIERGKALGAIEYYVKARLSIDDLITKVREFMAPQ